MGYLLFLSMACFMASNLYLVYFFILNTLTIKITAAMPTLSRNSMTDIIEHSMTASFRSGITTGARMDCQAYRRLLEAYPGIPTSGSSKIRLLMVFRVVAIRV